MNNNNAYITIATSLDYLPGLMALWLSLKKTRTQIPLYAMLPHELVITNRQHVNNLIGSGIKILEYNNSIQIPRQLIDINARQGDSRFCRTFDKLLIFNLTQFDKIVFIDADMQILHNIDHLFQLPHMSATIAGRSYPGNEDWVDLNSGIMTVVPQQGLTEKIAAKTPQVVSEKGACGDQDILQAYYSNWPCHPELDMGEKYNIFAGYASYYEHQLGYRFTNRIDDPKSVAVIHYIGEKKPWMQQWSTHSVMKQELQLMLLRLIHKRNTTAVLLEYKHLIRKARKLIYAKQ